MTSRSLAAGQVTAPCHGRATHTQNCDVWAPMGRILGIRRSTRSTRRNGAIHIYEQHIYIYIFIYIYTYPYVCICVHMCPVSCVPCPVSHVPCPVFRFLCPMSRVPCPWRACRLLSFRHKRATRPGACCHFATNVVCGELAKMINRFICNDFENT